MAFGKSTERKQADAIAAREQAEQAAQLAAVAARERAAQEHAASPVGRAKAACERGDRFFQIQLPVSALSGERSFFGSTDNRIEPLRNPRVDGKPDILTQIEDVGWRLEHVGYVFVATGATSSSRMIATGQATVTEDQINGIYLFRSART